jgi:protein-L-isoaspartate(D-aspartate) O-methyltransferase
MDSARAAPYARTMERLSDFRQVFAHVVVARGGCPDNEPLRHVFATVPRHDFVGPGPWFVSEDGTKTGSADPALVYQDIAIGLSTGIPSGLPSLHARLLATLRVARGERVMHVGAGTGYFTAILAELVGASGQVRAFEIDEALAGRARACLERWPWASVEARSGIRVPEQPVDLVYVNAGVQKFPHQWIEALAPGGRVLVPLVAADGQGAAFVIRRGDGDSHPARFVCRAQFVPCIGAEDAASGLGLADALRSGRCDAVRALRLAPAIPDATSWFAGDGWWLSTQGD